MSGVSGSQLRSIMVGVRSISGVSDFRAPVDNGEVRSILKVGRIVRAHGRHAVRGAERRGAGLETGVPSRCVILVGWNWCSRP